jgi:large repetitive protein
VLTAGMSWSALAADPAVNPQSGSVGLSGVVRGPAPSVAATILTPANGSRTTTIPITVSGTCPASTFVSLTKNSVFAGAAVCQSDGRFSMLIDLFDGANTIVARVSDALGQYGPDSSSITVFYDAPSLAQPGSSGVGRQLFLNMTTTVVAGNPGQPISRTVNIVGGVAPYAVSWDFGDDATSLASSSSDGAITATHTYERAGVYRVIVRVTDSVGNTAFLQFVTVVNGPPAPVGGTNGSGDGALPGRILAAWPVLGFAALLVLAFWMGERRATVKLGRRRFQTV